MKILILTTKFYHHDGSPWLTSELVDELHKIGHKVTILNLQWSNNYYDFNDNQKFKLINFSAFNIKIPFFSVALRWLFSSFKTCPFLIKSIVKNKKYDLLIAFSPCTAFYASNPFAHVLCQKSSLIYWDFFPSHNQEISHKAPKLFLPLLKLMERKLVSSFDQVGCMSRANVDFYKKYFGCPKKQTLRVTPVWTSFLNHEISDKSTIRTNLGISNDSIVIVFGGQLSHGRGIKALCEAVINANAIDKRIVLLICGRGILSTEILHIEAMHPLVIKMIGFVKRKDYLDILCASDIGAITTVSGVSSPSYPSKSLDYMACKLPIMAALEPASDFGYIAAENNFGLYCLANDIPAMTERILLLSSQEDLRKKMGKNGNKYLESTHDISKIVHLIVGENA